MCGVGPCQSPAVSTAEIHETRRRTPAERWRTPKTLDFRAYFRSLPSASQTHLSWFAISDVQAGRLTALAPRPGGRVSFVTLPWRPVHGIEKAMEAIENGEAHPY